jgi:hypothetical protein
MSRYEQLQKRKPKDFKRLIGVKRETFEAMIEVFRDYETDRKKSMGVGGRKSLCPEDKVLLMLSYYREYRTLEHIGFDYGVSESTASRVVREVEDVLIKSGKFSLPGKKALYNDGVELEFVVIDATEVPVQRPKKAAKILFRKEKTTHSERTDRD